MPKTIVILRGIRVTGLVDLPHAGQAPVDLNALPPVATQRQQGSTVNYTDKAYRWNRGHYSRHRRFVDIWSFVLTFLLSLIHI